VGLYLVMAFGPLRLDLRTAAVVAVVAVVGFDVELLIDNSSPGVFMLVVDGAAAFFFFMGTLLRTEHEPRTRADRLVVELEEPPLLSALRPRWPNDHDWPARCTMSWPTPCRVWSCSSTAPSCWPRHTGLGISP
jgi:hypothetical protein